MYPVHELTIEHKNKYREIMVNRDIQSSLWSVLKECNPRYIFIDLIEERFDVIKYNGGYITKSDAWEETNYSENLTIIPRLSQECDVLWKESFVSFVNNVKMVDENMRIVVIENYLSETYGDVNTQTAYPDIEYIKNINKKLSEYYNFISVAFPEIIRIEAYKCNNYYTDCKYEYGVQSSHLNDCVNRDIADLIYNKL